MREGLRRSRIALERATVRKELERDHAEAVAVACGSRRLASRLLRRQVAGGAEDGPGKRQRVEPSGGGDTEVGDDKTPVPVEQEVRRLHVAVDDALGVGPVERLSCLIEPLERHSGRNSALTEPVGHGAAFEVLHDDVRLRSVLADVEDRDHMRSPREPGGGEGLASEPSVRVLVTRVPLGEQLDSDLPLKDGVDRAVHLAHAAARDEGRRRVPLR